MLIKVNQALKDYEGKPVTEATKDGLKEVNLKSVLVNALNFTQNGPSGKDMSIEDKLRAYKLSIEIMSKDDVDFTVEDLALIKKNINIMYSPLIVGQVVMLIEGSQEKKEVVN